MGVHHTWYYILILLKKILTSFSVLDFGNAAGDIQRADSSRLLQANGPNESRIS